MCCFRYQETCTKMRQNFISKLRNGPGMCIASCIVNFINQCYFHSGYRPYGPQIVKPVQRNIPTSGATGQQLLALAGVKLVGNQRLTSMWVSLWWYFGFEFVLLLGVTIPSKWSVDIGRSYMLTSDFIYQIFKSIFWLKRTRNLLYSRKYVLLPLYRHIYKNLLLYILFRFKICIYFNFLKLYNTSICTKYSF